ncbi:hypothetical protein DL897_17380 [Thermoflavimicrobium daqui]|uniref:histidine kinase n=1 Tax=Thermoflavimicrobium daqui TaxID=2137476 RepID=A0A364K0Y5_9BACL|nr:hypothetical protein DL897_17380 [Thermoflavimicrobium daqui]
MALESNYFGKVEIEEQNRVLEYYSKQVERITLLEERNRLARELHDSVGHTFTSVIMGMDAVSYLIDTNPEEGKKKLDRLREVARNGLEEVRRSIHQMAPLDEGVSFSEHITHICKEFASHTNTKIVKQVEGEERRIAKPIFWTLTRCLQEALTNAKRHGHAKTIYVKIIYHIDWIELRVEDDGIGMNEEKPGFGIISMNERIESLKGSFMLTGNQYGGVTMICRIPLSNEGKEKIS